MLVPELLVKLTLPVGLAADGEAAVTVAVRMAEVPQSLGSGFELRTVVVLAVVTLWVKVPELEL
jgi:hypothetical protein